MNVPWINQRWKRNEDNRYYECRRQPGLFSWELVRTLSGLGKRSGDRPNPFIFRLINNRSRSGLLTKRLQLNLNEVND